MVPVKGLLGALATPGAIGRGLLGVGSAVGRMYTRAAVGGMGRTAQGIAIGGTIGALYGATLGSGVKKDMLYGAGIGGGIGYARSANAYARSGASISSALSSAARSEGSMLKAQGMHSGRFIGRTAHRAFNRIKGLYV